ncbi:MAG: oligoendopeptidase F [Apilactobacillus sp.]|uniref:oligoendopeptidase F n=1 Tax=Apilactobacillus sp. TaxID=2767901 RepID=UPI0025DB33A5|nr:oligoendopeptidase F [Apilactobacillus sp.]MCT6823160.1 oligoendopeptidase F [Apilactobacillus sp.]MCT6857932.1 oligoendopeptidase F [Apilactobacillus sp.]
MTEVQQLPARQDVPEELTWDLTTIFPSDDDFEQAFKECLDEIEEVKKLRSETFSADVLLSDLKAMEQLDRHVETLYVYSSLKSDADTSDNKYQSMNSRCSDLASKAEQAVSWFEPAILKLDQSEVADMVNSNDEIKQFQHFFDELFSQKDHILDEEHEKILSSLSNIFQVPSNVYGIITNSDMKFPIVKDPDGNSVELSNGVYSKLLESTDRSVRKEAFQKLYSIYDQFKNTLASTLSGEVKVHNFSAEMRKYDSAKQAALSRNHIDQNVYQNLIDSVNKHLPLLHRYVKLRKKLLGLDEMHMYDLYTPLFGKSPISYNYEEAQAESLKALNVLGPDYISHIKDEFNQRWIDVVENKGKRSGAYSSGVYDTNPFILLNWQDNLDNLFTLVHESGHSMHSYYTTHNQPFQYGGYSIFLAEIASTTNENILTDYLLKHTDDVEVKKYVLNHFLDGFKGTIFRQTQFAEFEDFAHQQEQKGNPLNAEMLSDFYLELNKRYYGEGVVSDPEIAYEWSRIPHFYMNYYVYQYATGFAAAIDLSEGICANDQDKIEKYLNYLKSGSSEYPLDVMKKAGVDMTSTDYLDNAFKVFEERLNELEKLV